MTRGRQRFRLDCATIGRCQGGLAPNSTMAHTTRTRGHNARNDGEKSWHPHPGTKRAQRRTPPHGHDTANGSLRLGNGGGSESIVLEPDREKKIPSCAQIVQVFTGLVGLYYRHMRDTGHHSAIDNVTTRYRKLLDMPGKIHVAEIACGLAHTLGFVSELLHDRIVNIDERKRDGPVILSGVDNCPGMLVEAEKNMNGLLFGLKAQMESTTPGIEVEIKRTAANRGKLVTISLGVKLGRGEEVELVRVQLIKANAITNMHKVEELQGCTLMFVPYGFQWFKGRKGKEHAAANMRATVDPEVGIVIPMDEEPLVITLEGGKLEEAQIGSMVEGIWVVSVGDTHEMLVEAGFKRMTGPAYGAVQQAQIDTHPHHVNSLPLSV